MTDSDNAWQRLAKRAQPAYQHAPVPGVGLIVRTLIRAREKIISSPSPVSAWAEIERIFFRAACVTSLICVLCLGAWLLNSEYDTEALIEPWGELP